MDEFLEIVNSFEFQTFLKLILGGLLTGLIGLERSAMNKPAGFGTHALLGVSAVLIVICSQYLSLNYDIDMSRIPAQLLSGIGFIGAGTILRNGASVKGVTTATGLLAVTCIGLCIGAGYYIGGIIATVIVYLILTYSHNISDPFERFTTINLSISIKNDVSETIKKINNYFTDNKIEIKKIDRTENKNKETVVNLVANYDSRHIKKNKIIEELFTIANIVGLEEQE